MGPFWRLSIGESLDKIVLVAADTPRSDLVGSLNVFGPARLLASCSLRADLSVAVWWISRVFN